MAESLSNLEGMITGDLLLIDATLNKEVGGYWSRGIELEFRSGFLSKRYPELFRGSFNKINIEEKNGAYELTQYFIIGHEFSEMPGKTLGWVEVEEPEKGSSEEGKGEKISPELKERMSREKGKIVERRVMTTGLVERDISGRGKRELLTADKIQGIAYNTFVLMSSDAKGIEIDYDDSADRWAEVWRPFWPSDMPEDFILEEQVKKGFSHPVYSHLFSEMYPDFFENRKNGKKPYIGSMLILPKQVGELAELSYAENFRKFYDALRQVMAQRGYALTDFLA